MAKNTLDPEELNPQEIKDILKSRQEYRVALRLQMVYLIHQGKSSREVADIYQVSFKQVLNWVHRFKHQGMDGLEDKSGRGRKASLNEKELGRIRRTVLNTDPSEYGYTSMRWTGPLLLKWINKEYKTEFTAATIYKLLEKMGLEYQNGKGYVSLD